MTEREAREAIADDDRLLRRIRDQPEKMWTKKGGVLRPSSAALKPHQADGGLSVDVRRLLADPRSPGSVLDDDRDDGLVEFEARRPRDAGLDVEHAPLEGRYSHANIVGFERFDRAGQKRVRRELAKQAVWVQTPASAAAGAG